MPSQWTQEGAAADAGALRLDEVEHELDRDGRVDGAAARREDLPAGLGRERVRGGDHVLRRGAGPLSRAAGRRLGRERGERAAPAGAREREGDKPAPASRRHGNDDQSCLQARAPNSRAPAQR